MLFSSSGVVFSKHYCQGELKSIAFFSEAESCHDSKKARSCPFHPPVEEDKEEPTRKDCCEDESEIIKLDEDIEVPQFDLDLPEYQQLVAVLLVTAELFSSGSDSKTLHYLNYKPPLIVRDLPVSLQTFLI
ncbi:hypothetical protein CEQ90_04120 [Lewinellaceae bacterium SD302]|nr:hypothetical protein CEQ90_04120 [Lewinellaceae bacterium SD302]